MYLTKPVWSHVLALSCYNPLRLGTVIVLVSSGIDFVLILHVCIVPEPPAKRYCQSAWTLQETHSNSTSYARDEARTPECLL